MYTIAIANQKGGSGKSTLSECLAVAAHLAGRSVGILDLDPQGSAYKWGKRRESADPVVLSVTPANCQDELARLKEAGADFVIIDTPARLEESTSEAIRHADLVIIPAKATLKDLERVGATYSLMTKIADTPAFIVLNQVRASGDRAEQAKTYLKGQGYTISPHHFGHYVAFEDADLTGQTPQEIAAKSKAAEQIAKLYQFTVKVLKF